MGVLCGYLLQIGWHCGFDQESVSDCKFQLIVYDTEHVEGFEFHADDRNLASVIYRLT